MCEHRSKIEQDIAKHETWLGRLVQCDQRVRDFPHDPKLLRLHRRIQLHERKVSAELDALKRRLAALPKAD